ncbi:MAG TPA: hypothetical protein VM451_05100 [Candidatus Limnocylindria bacterium]|nr:hypothetical protein [Candidatus Limnocylindria bacterium]
MEEQEVREAAQAVGDALVAGNVDGAIEYLSEELKRNLGEVVALLPLPATEATISSIERATSAFVVIVKVVGETSDVELQTRWKDRDGEPRIVEVSHLSQVERELPEAGADEDESTGADQAG